MADQDMSPQGQPPASQPQSEPQQPPTFGDLEKMIDDAKAAEVDKGQQLEGQTPPPGEPAPQDKVDDLSRALEGTGFKSLDDLVKSQKEAHATVTRLSQEKSAILRDMAALHQFKDMVLAQQGQAQPQGQAVKPGEDPSIEDELLQAMAPKLQKIIDQRLSDGLTYVKMAERISAKRSQNPEEFDELRPIMEQIVQKNPQLEMMPNGLDVLYENAKKVRDQRVEKLSSMTFKRLMPDVPLDKIQEALKAIISGQLPQQSQTASEVVAAAPNPQAGYVPPSSAGQPPFTQKPIDYDAEIKGIMNGPKVERDMVDRVTDNWWAKVNQQAQRR